MQSTPNSKGQYASPFAQDPAVSPAMAHWLPQEGPQAEIPATPSENQTVIGSILQAESHPSPFALLLSSHASPESAATMYPLPHPEVM